MVRTYMEMSEETLIFKICLGQHLDQTYLQDCTISVVYSKVPVRNSLEDKAFSYKRKKSCPKNSCQAKKVKIIIINNRNSTIIWNLLSFQAYCQRMRRLWATTFLFQTTSSWILISRWRVLTVMLIGMLWLLKALGEITVVVSNS